MRYYTYISYKNIDLYFISRDNELFPLQKRDHGRTTFTSLILNMILSSPFTILLRIRFFHLHFCFPFRQTITAFSTFLFRIL
jgi:hypothetical protein